MKFKVIVVIIDNDKKREICYADDFEKYTDAYDYANFLDDPNNWNSPDLPSPPLYVYVTEY